MDNECIQVEVEDNLVSWIEPKLDMLRLIDTESGFGITDDGNGGGS